MPKKSRFLYSLFCNLYIIFVQFYPDVVPIFSEFLQPQTVNNSILVVGYDSQSNQEVKIPIAALIVQGSVEVQYYLDGANWHTTYTAGDCYMCVKVGTGQWSAPIPIGDNAVKIENIPTEESVGSEYLVIVTEDGLRKISLEHLREELEKSVQLPMPIELIEKQDGSNMIFTTEQE